MGRINEIAAASAAAVDSVHAERVRLKPMIGNQHAGARPDGARPECTIEAPLLIGSELEQLDSKGRNDADKFGAGAAVLYIARSIWPADTKLRKDDVVIALDRPGEPAFTVAHVDPRPRARIIVHLSGA